MTEHAQYAWVIDRDYLCEQDASAGRNDVGTSGPHDADPDFLDRLANGYGHKFRIYDDDGELYYSGRFIADDGIAGHVEDGWHSEYGFGPLDDFGTPNAGATEIRYYQAGAHKYVTL